MRHVMAQKSDEVRSANIANTLGFMGVYATFLSLNVVFLSIIAIFALQIKVL